VNTKTISAGALRLGARILGYGPADLQLNTGETTVLPFSQSAAPV